MRTARLAVLTAATMTVMPVVAHAQGKPSTPSSSTGPAASATTGVTVPAGYVIGPEDVIGVMFWRDTEMTGDVSVRPDGVITLQLLGEIKAAGLTPDQLRDVIKQAASKLIEDPTVTIVVRAINSRKVFITGQVTTPGEYPLIAPRTVMQLIAVAGGLTEYADAKNIRIVRSEGDKTTSHKFNYKDVSKGTKLEQNIQLKPGDTVIVP
jgi:polysaccharide export outer membrane protein